MRGAKPYNFTDFKDALRLHLNESPYPPPKFVLDAVSSWLDRGNRYPTPDLTERFRRLAAEYNGVEPSNIYPSPGGDGGIRQLFYNFLAAGSTVTINSPSYSMYEVYSAATGMRLLKVNLREEGDSWKEDLPSLYTLAAQSDLVAIDDPNNPTGSPMLEAKRELIEELSSRAKGLVLIDEAYYEFSKYTVAKMVQDFPNVIALRTMSKAFSMAAFRVGYLIADREIVDALMKVSTPFDVALPGLVAGIAALESPSYALRVADEVSRNRERLRRELLSLGLKVYQSVTNFLLVRSETDILTPLLSKGIAIRKYGKDLYRITVGTEAENRILVTSLGGILEDSRSK
ncbi:histidinol-phosphate transaminase [Sulfodiicoccus acidiphilus]|uniref:histidinol-phosphate transaminase n=1 Tax=Sulfodiicoccus acidiphilus TaxID=1670455 RepID=A0A348B734_9CREN|nr:histidinol-phosphate transaminase [Sulfodiicoccus acidiphilus]GGU02646.1 histidinol-phosphate transaminase [Sulfodiicoccus acidiphilus]